MADRLNLPGRVQAELRRLQLMTVTLLLIGAASLVAFSSFALWEVHQTKQRAAELEQLTNDLCRTLHRAGIIISGTKEHPCEP